MRIGFDARYTGDHFPGIGRYSLSLIRALAELSLDHQLIVFDHRSTHSSRYRRDPLSQISGIEVVPVQSGPFSATQQLELPMLARTWRLDLLHSPYLVKPYLLPCPSVVAIHDLLGMRFPKTLSWRGRLAYRTVLNLAVRSAAAIITLSQHSLEDIVYFCGVPRERINVTLLAATSRFVRQPPDAVRAMRERYHLPERYILYLGSSKSHKNLERLVRAWERVLNQAQYSDARTGVRLVLAGHADAQQAVLRRFVMERGLTDHVQFVPNVAEADLALLYSGALFFAFPSYYEGFGLPPLEAMACGTPVLCAYSSSLPEVVGEAALTVDPYSVHEIAEGLGRLLVNASLRTRLSHQGLERARQFSWRRTAFETLSVYEKLSRSR